MNWRHHRANFDGQLGLQRGGDRRGDFILHRENVGEVAVPHSDDTGHPSAAFHQLRRDSNPRPALAHAAFEHVVDAEVARDVADLVVGALEGERRRAGRHVRVITRPATPRLAGF